MDELEKRFLMLLGVAAILGAIILGASI